MNVLRLLALGTSLAVAAPALAQQGTKADPAMLAKIKDEGLNRSKVMETAFYLTDVCGPRLANSAGLARANEWTKKQLTDWGLVKANVEPWGTFGRGWDIEKSYVAMTAPYYHTLIGAPKAWTPGTNGPLKKQVVVLKATTEAELEKYKGQLRDKIVLLDVTNVPKPSFEPDARRHSDADLQKMADFKPEPSTATPDAAEMEKRMAQRRTQMALRTKMSDMVLAEGAADCYPRLAPTSQWDTAAAQGVLEGAGGEVLDLAGAPFCYPPRESLLNGFFLALPAKAPWRSRLLDLARS